MMEEAYAAVGQAIARLLSGTGEDIDHAKIQAILRLTLQQRPVALGYALTTFARRLREGEGAPQQRQQQACSGEPEPGLLV